MKIKNTIDLDKQSIEGIITKGAIAMIKGIDKLELADLKFHDTEIVKASINYPEEGDFYIDIDMRLEWGRYSRLSWRFEGLITYKICDDGGDRYLDDAGFAKDGPFLVAELGCFAQIKCLRAEITDVAEFENGISPAQAIVDEHYKSGKKGIPCVSIKRMQSF